MIHTITIQYRLDYSTMKTLLERLQYSAKDIRNFFYPNKGKKGDLPYTKHTPLGVDELYFTNIEIIDYKHQIPMHLYYFYLKLEPYTLINGEQYIQLFECTEENNSRFRESFSQFVTKLLKIKDNDVLLPLTDLYNWEANRVDYTHDIRMNNHDEVLLFMNLAKWIALENTYNKSEKPSTYGMNFFDKSFKFGNKSWEITVYDKQAEIASKKTIPAPVQERLIDEADNIVRIEYRRLTPGTKKASTNFESRNIRDFLDEDKATEWFYKCYEGTIGYQDFYVQYHAQKAIDAAFPMTKVEEKAEKKKLRESKDMGMRYTPEKHSKKSKHIMEYMLFIMAHKGINNAFNAVKETFTDTICELKIGEMTPLDVQLFFEDIENSPNDIKNIMQKFICLPQDFIKVLPKIYAMSDEMLQDDKTYNKLLDSNIRSIFRNYNKRIRDKVNISPIMVPDAWIYKRKNMEGTPLDIPHDIFKNPVTRPV